MSRFAYGLMPCGILQTHTELELEKFILPRSWFLTSIRQVKKPSSSLFLSKQTCCAYLYLYASSSLGFLKLKSQTDAAKKEKRAKKMRMSSTWFNRVRRKFHRKLNRNISIRHSPNPSQEVIIIDVPEAAASYSNRNSSVSSAISYQKKEATKEDIAAIKIQAIFRGHLVCFRSI